ncbi:MAG: lycopene cyclase domain-containing protein [Flammeovirgaceae bacterium]|jgi:lycopene cyclase domain-containing protein
MAIYTYLLLNILTISYPLYKSFDSRVDFYKKWKNLFIAISITGAVFLYWDYLFTDWGVWSFNEEYILGIHFFQLPIEEWLFFLTVPFACIFIHEVLKYFVKKDILQPYTKQITLFLIILFGVISTKNPDKLYTFVNFGLATILLGVHWSLFDKQMIGRFYLTYLVTLIPFLIVNGILTYLPVVEYDNAENLRFRIGTIPIEDMVYSMILLFMNLTIYEYLNRRDLAKSNQVESTPTNT